MTPSPAQLEYLSMRIFKNTGLSQGFKLEGYITLAHEPERASEALRVVVKQDLETYGLYLDNDDLTAILRAAQKLGWYVGSVGVYPPGHASTRYLASRPQEPEPVTVKDIGMELLAPPDTEVFTRPPAVGEKVPPPEGQVEQPLELLDPITGRAFRVAGEWVQAQAPYQPTSFEQLKDNIKNAALRRVEGKQQFAQRREELDAQEQTFLAASEAQLKSLFNQLHSWAASDNPLWEDED